MEKSNHELHMELYFWCAENPEKTKEDWPKFKEVGYPEHHCFACREVNRSCRHCPIDWESKPAYDGEYRCEGEESIYAEWKNETDLEKRSIMAEVIACKEWVGK